MQQQSAIITNLHLHFIRILLATAPFFLMSSCAPYKIKTEDLLINPENAVYTQKQESCDPESAANHWLYNIVPRHRCQLQWYDLGHWITWTLFGNDDDGIFGEGPSAHFRLDTPPSLGKALAWECRNPLHNFCFYVIGSAYRQNSEFDIIKITPAKVSGFHYEPIGSTVFADENSSFYIALHGGKPFISMRLAYNQRYRSDVYLGWRCRGNFGLKFVPLTKTKTHATMSCSKS